MRRRRRPRGRGALGGADPGGTGAPRVPHRAPLAPGPFLPELSPSPQLRTPGQLRGPLARGRGCGGLAAAPSCHRQTFLFLLFFFSLSPPSSFRLLPTLELSIYSSEAQGKCAMFVDFSLYVDQDRNLRVLIFSLLGRGFAWLISLSILAKFVVVVVPWVICGGSEGRGTAEDVLALPSTPATRAELEFGVRVGRTLLGEAAPKGGRHPRRLCHTKGQVVGIRALGAGALGHARLPGAGQGKGAGCPPLSGPAAALLPLLLSPLASSSR